jgi:hypothetical protein
MDVLTDVSGTLASRAAAWVADPGSTRSLITRSSAHLIGCYDSPHAAAGAAWLKRQALLSLEQPMPKRREGMTIQSLRRFALALPDVTEEPHFEYASFRVSGRIFVTVPPGATHIHVFVDDGYREPALELHPEYIEKLWWGKKVRGVRVAMARADTDVVKALVGAAWARRAPKQRRRAPTISGNGRA